MKSYIFALRNNFCKNKWQSIIWKRYPEMRLKWQLGWFLREDQNPDNPENKTWQLTLYIS
jgi:hypothetical protein